MNARGVSSHVGVDEFGLPLPRTLPDLLRHNASLVPDSEALVIGAHRRTYAELAADADEASRRLSTVLTTGSRVALLAPNIVEWIPIAIGAQSLGLRLNAFNTWVKAYDIDYLLRSSQASVLVLVDRVRNSDLIGELVELVPEMLTGPPGAWSSAAFPHLREVIVIGDDVPLGARAWSELRETRRVDDWEAVPNENDPAFVLYTSGSTKYPKAVPLCHRDLIVNGFLIGERMGLCPQDRVWFGSPLFWSFGCANALMATFTHQACFVLQEQFEPQAVAALIQEERVTAAYLLPAMIDSLATNVADQVRAVETLRTGLMIGRPDEFRRAAVDLGIRSMCNVYGSTETYGNCCVTSHDLPLDVRATTQGLPLPGVEVRVTDQDTGAVLPTGSEGELQVRGRLTPGYLNDDESNAAAFTADGWYRTGDRMTINGDGSVRFVGRISDMIKTSGINVSPAEVESFLSTHPDIAESVVVAAPDPSRDEVVVAFVISKSGTLTEAEVIDYCKQNIAGYKVPRAVSVVETLPRTGTGKIVRRTLAADAAQLVGHGPLCNPVGGNS